MPNILVIEDEDAIRRVLVKILKQEVDQVHIEEANNGRTGLKQFESMLFDLVLCDIKMPDVDGVEVLQRAKEINSDVPFIMISGHGDLETAVETMRLGAFDYISKPPDLNRLLTSVKNALDKNLLQQENKQLKKKIAKAFEMVGNSPAIEKIKSMIEKVAPSEASPHNRSQWYW